MSDQRGPVSLFDFGVEEWMNGAACRDKPQSWFFPGRGESKRRGLAVCAECPVIKDCAEYAERTHTQYGIWGGKIMKRTAEPEAVSHTQVVVEIGYIRPKRRLPALL